MKGVRPGPRAPMDRDGSIASLVSLKETGPLLFIHFYLFFVLVCSLILVQI
jgi:hypothetical protein